MRVHTRKKEVKLVHILIVLVIAGIVGYVLDANGIISISNREMQHIEDLGIIASLNVNEKSETGLNEKLVYSITADGIKTYSLTGEELWKDTFSIKNFVVVQKTPYFAVGGKQGNQVIVFNNNGRKADIKTVYPMQYFSINEKGWVATIQNSKTSYIVTAYDDKGSKVCERITPISNEGYPVSVEISPDCSRLIISYLSVDEPKVVSTLKAINLKDTQTEEVDNIEYGYRQEQNLVYEIEFVSDNIWVSIGDKMVNWYTLDGDEIGSIDELSLVYKPYLVQIPSFGQGYLPIVETNKPTQNIVHRQDKVSYFNEKGEKIFSKDIGDGVSYFYSDKNGIIIEVGNFFEGYNRLGNMSFRYKATTDVTRLIYNPALKKGIAVNKENIILIGPKKGGVI